MPYAIDVFKSFVEHQLDSEAMEAISTLDDFIEMVYIHLLFTSINFLSSARSNSNQAGARASTYNDTGKREVGDRCGSTTKCFVFCTNGSTVVCL